MKDSYFWKCWLLFSAFVASGTALLMHYLPALLFDDIWVFLLFFTLLIPIVYFLSIRGISKGGRESVFILLGANVMKMIAALSFAGYYILKFPINSLVFGWNFFIIYVLFSVFEIHCLLHNLRLPKKDNNSSNR